MDDATSPTIGQPSLQARDPDPPITTEMLQAGRQAWMDIGGTIGIGTRNGSEPMPSEAALFDTLIAWCYRAMWRARPK